MGHHLVCVGRGARWLRVVVGFGRALGDPIAHTSPRAGGAVVGNAPFSGLAVCAFRGGLPAEGIGGCTLSLDPPNFGHKWPQKPRNWGGCYHPTGAGGRTLLGPITAKIRGGEL